MRALEGVDSALSTCQKIVNSTNTSAISSSRRPVRHHSGRHHLVALSGGTLCASQGVQRVVVGRRFPSAHEDILSRQSLCNRRIFHVLGVGRLRQGRLLRLTASEKKSSCETPSQIASAWTLVKKTGAILVVTAVRWTTPTQFSL